MPGFLTTASTMSCPHGGTVQAVPASTQVQADQSPVLTTGDTFTIAGCAFNISGVPSPCTTIQWVAPAMRSKVGGNQTLTLASVGLCLAATQAPQGPVVISNTQSDAGGL